MFEKEIAASLYKCVYGELLDANNYNDRIKLQKAAYLMEAVGVPCGEYSFIWYLHGPYSYALDIVASELQNVSIEEYSNIEFDERTKAAIDKVQTIISLKDSFGLDYDYYWPETLASLHYLMHYRIPKSSKDEVLSVLVETSPYLEGYRMMLDAAYEKIYDLYFF